VHERSLVHERSGEYGVSTIKMGSTPMEIIETRCNKRYSLGELKEAGLRIVWALFVFYLIWLFLVIWN
jgi:hypothetical protein